MNTAAIDFIKLLYEPGDLLCFGFLNSETKKWQHAFRPYEVAIQPEFIEKLREANKAGNNVYIAMNVYKGPQRTEDNIASIRSVWAELDENGRENLDKIFDNKVVPDPTIVNESSPNKFHAIWKVKDLNVADAKALLKAICTEFNGDKNATDTARVLRLPGFKNCKYPEQPEVEVVHLSTNSAAHEVSEFSLAPKNVPETVAAPSTPTMTRTEEATAKLIAAIFEKGQDVLEGGRDNALTSVAGALHNLGLSLQDLEYHLGLYNDRFMKPLLDAADVRKIARSIHKKPVIDPDAMTPLIGGKLAGEPSIPVSTVPATKEQIAKTCMDYFRSVGEMESGDIEQVIEGVLQEGTCFLGATPASGKTLVALSMSKAVCTGAPLFGIESYKVKKPRQVIYLIPESGDHAFRKRCEAFGIPDDKKKFMARTISSGVPLELSDPILIEAIRQTKPVIFLDTASRFMKSKDENAAAQNRFLVNDVITLLAAGAVTVVLVHHATKASKKETMTLENMLRGSSDLGAMCDQAYGIRKDDVLHANGAGPMEIDLVNLKDREQMGGLTKLRLAASYVAPQGVGVISYINTEGDFKIVNHEEVRQRLDDLLVQYVTADPTMPQEEIAEELGFKSGRVVSRMLNKLGWHRVKGGPEGASPWHKDEGKPCPYSKEQLEVIKIGNKKSKSKSSESIKQLSIDDVLRPVKGDVELVDPYPKAGN